jgi:hypothetical protein
MQQNTKKNIAKEILILTTILVISLLCWLVIYPYNAFKKQQISTAEKQIEVLYVEIDTLKYKLPSEKRKNLYNSLKSVRPDLLGDMGEDEFVNKFADSTKSAKLYDLMQSEGNVFVGDLGQEEFIVLCADDLSENSVSSKFNKIESNKEYLSKKIEDNQLEIFTSDEHKNLFIKVLGILFCLAYPLRFLFLAVKWSLKILKE